MTAQRNIWLQAECSPRTSRLCWERGLCIGTPRHDTTERGGHGRDDLAKEHMPLCGLVALRNYCTGRTWATRVGSRRMLGGSWNPPPAPSRNCILRRGSRAFLVQGSSPWWPTWCTQPSSKSRWTSDLKTGSLRRGTTAGHTGEWLAVVLKSLRPTGMHRRFVGSLT